MKTPAPLAGTLVWCDPSERLGSSRAMAGESDGTWCVHAVPSSGSSRRTCSGEEQSPEAMAILAQKHAENSWSDMPAEKRVEQR